LNGKKESVFYDKKRMKWIIMMMTMIWVEGCNVRERKEMIVNLRRESKNGTVILKETKVKNVRGCLLD